MKRNILAGFALSLFITVSSCRESAEATTDEAMQETSMEEVTPEAPVLEEERRCCFQKILRITFRQF